MNISMHNASVGVYLKILGNLNIMLEKAEKWTAERKIDPNAILQARLAPDMFTFTRQVQIATDMAKGTAGRLAGEEPPRYEDNEASFAELRARVAKTIAYLQSLKADAFTGGETRTITLKLGPPGNQREMNFQGLDYLLGFGTPNVYFHFSMVYALLRHNGLEIGKRDYTG
ncbi:MAG: DUF1993 domain-containing protein [Proteobacteria bacterium]|jgi:hypothetical protein|nr:DUF1993 domain-containing protein [Pseudomonadota bacterium]MBK7114862.1 DUF1993 domain-containing protein [Pseudomonadota bacterium]MBK9251911.1 DUF1993 domain-containing protein [Pseudomonadota bacterium]MCC6631436.1 DUF1993 domain-containing protein [Gammaproteobacteria bacterium]